MGGKRLVQLQELLSRIHVINRGRTLGSPGSQRLLVKQWPVGLEYLEDCGRTGPMFLQEAVPRTAQAGNERWQ